MVNTRIAYSLVWCWIFVILTAGEGHSFYHLNEKSQYLFFQRERCNAPWGEGEVTFALYDNFNHFSAKYRQEPIICPRSDDFVSADLILCSIPLQVATNNLVTVENSLTDLIYANLKLKKLLEEKEDLQKRARETLAHLNVPYVDFHMAFLERTRIKQDATSYGRSAAGPGESSDPSGRNIPESVRSFRNRLRSSERRPLYLPVGPLARRSERRSVYLFSGNAARQEGERPSHGSETAPGQVRE